MELLLLLLQAESAEELPIAPETFAIIGLVMTLVFLVIAVAAGYWVYKDAADRENNETLWAIAVGGLLFLTFFFGIIALIAYFFLRSDVVEPETERVDAGPEAEW